MKDMEYPIQTVRPLSMVALSAEKNDKIYWEDMKLAINEFSTYEDYIGLFQSEPEPETFFSVQKIESA